MNIHNHKRYLVCLIFLVLFLNPVQADDTDIFLGNGVYQEGVLPNVLFILDNSGSMNSTARDANGNSLGSTRLETMKVAFSDIISNVSSISGVNMGLMRFNAPGGSIMYPVTNINTVLGTTSLLTHPDMKVSADDARQDLTSGVMVLDETSSSMGFAHASDSLVNIRIPTVHQDDDREESQSSGYPVDGSHLNIDSSNILGLRYLNMGIPAGATIISASLDFHSPSSGYVGDVEVQIRGQYADNPARFTGAQYDVANRWNSQGTSSIVDWSIFSNQVWDLDNRYSSPDLTNIIQELVDHPSWDPNDAVVLMIDYVTGSGRRAGTLYRDSNPSTQGLNGTNTHLNITYSINSTLREHMTGLRFQDVRIPQGATIDSAYINFTSSQTHGTHDGLQLKVRVENTDDAAEFTSGAFALSSRNKYINEVLWSPEGDWIADSSITGPDVTNLVQLVVNRSGWCGNNSMAFYLEPTAISAETNRYHYTRDDDLQRHAELVVNYTEAGTNGCINEYWSKRVNSQEDDAEENNSGYLTNSSSDLDIESSQYLGMRFENLPVLQGATIQSAYLELTSYDDDGGDMHVDVYAHDTDNSPAFPNSRYNISNRNLTSQSVRWSPEDWYEDEVYTSPDLTAIVQEVVNRAGWEPGNALSIILRSDSSSTDRDAYTYDASTGKAPKLILKIANDGISSTSFTVRDHIDDMVQNLDARTWTPIVDSLYEAALYFRGDNMHYGVSRELFPEKNGDTDRRYKRVSVADSYTGGTHIMPSGCTADNLDSTSCRDEMVVFSPSVPVYKSPILSDCQTNHVVLLTDGEANNNHSEDLISTLIGSSCSSDSSRSGEKCGRSLAQWMANNDMMPSFPATTNSIKTHAIAFNLSNSSAVTFLEDLASSGNGSYHSANTAAELADAFDAIIREIVSQSSTFTSAGATVNQFNRLTHRSDIYFSVFKPEAEPRWPGNLKRYKLLGNPPVISDDNDQAAIDTSTGFFKSTAKSVWSSDIDGAEIERGGAANKLPSNPSSRKLYTYLPNATTPSTLLTHSVNAFETANTDITQAMVNAVDAADRANIIRWAMGYDLKDVDQDLDTSDARKQIGDPMHSVPMLVTYGGTEENPDIEIFFGSNEGFIHSIDASTGEESFAFIPEPLLANLDTLYDNQTSYNHPYGMDGSPVSWVVDHNYDNQIDLGTDSVYLYQGMRRGGRHYYALDVTDRSAPEILWTIEGGSTDFMDLGYTWSKPVKTRIKIGSDTKDVLLFAGGFDPNIDNHPSTRVTASMGNAIYMVDAVTGQRLWMAAPNVAAGQGLSLSDMNYAIPSELAVIDVNQDGLADQFYVGDVGGQLWRFDIHHGRSTSTLVTGGVIAELGGASGSDFRRLYFAPDISMFVQDGDPRLAVSIGSGAINEPLEQVSLNRFHVIFQNDVFSAPEAYTRLTDVNLTDRTSLNDDVNIQNNGWYIDLPNSGEKVLASSISVNNQVIFTTYTPDTAVSACSGVTGVGRVYLVNLFNGNAVADLNNSGSITEIDRSRLLQAPSIPPTPKMLFPAETDAPTILVGPEQPLQDVDLGISNSWSHTYWFEPEE